MVLSNTHRLALIVFSALLVALTASAQESNIYVQCPTETVLHPSGGDGIKCGHLVAGDGMVTMADDVDPDGVGPRGKQLYIFSFAELPSGGPAENTPEYAGWVMDQGLLAANAPAPTISVDEDDEFFLTLTNVGMAMRPDLFDPHTIHWHGFAQASAIFDGVPDASISVNMAASLTYYYNAKDAGTYMYHCHVEAAEHMQMGMLGNLFVRPRQNRCDTLADDVTIPGTVCPGDHALGYTYAYNDGDGSTRYDVEVPIQIGSFDPDFHDASLNVQPLPFAGMRDRYFLLNGRGYPDTVNPGALSTMDPLGNPQVSQPVSSLITATPGQRILLRISNLSVTNFYTLGTSGLPMDVVGLDARLLRDGAGNNMNYKTNSLTLGGGQSADVIITAPATAGTYFLYTKNLHQLANDAENFGGMMTEICVGTGTLCP
jgi:FtsP/CotA-like multicopper oxidase with cupredoxin domain